MFGSDVARAVFIGVIYYTHVDFRMRTHESDRHMCECIHDFSSLDFLIQHCDEFFGGHVFTKNYLEFVI